MNRTSLAIIFVILALGAAGSWWYFLYTIKGMEADISAASAEFNATQDRNTKLSSMHALAQDVQSNMSALDRAFTNRDDVATFVDNLEAQASKSHVKITVSDLAVDDAASGVIVSGLHVRADIEGSETAVHQFIQTLESSEPILIINRAVLTRFQDEKKNVVWKTALDITGYVIN